MCDPGTTELMTLTVPVDQCMVPFMRALNEGGIITTASCCGHGKFPSNVMLEDGRCLILCDKASFDQIFMDWGARLADKS